MITINPLGGGIRRTGSTNWRAIMRPSTVLKFSATLVTLLAMPLAAMADFSIDGNHETRTIDCKGQNVGVMGNHNVLRLKNCNKLYVAGNHNAVLASPARTVYVAGNYNRVKFVRAADIPADITISAAPGNYNDMQEVTAAQATAAWNSGGNSFAGTGSGVGAEAATGVRTFSGVGGSRSSQVNIRPGGIKIKTTGSNAADVNIGPGGIQVRNADGTTVNIGN
jgi:hypothetical protein